VRACALIHVSFSKREMLVGMEKLGILGILAFFLVPRRAFSLRAWLAWLPRMASNLGMNVVGWKGIDSGIDRWIGVSVWTWGSSPPEITGHRGETDSARVSVLNVSAVPGISAPQPPFA
jgi:hypothetical protein